MIKASLRSVLTNHKVFQRFGAKCDEHPSLKLVEASKVVVLPSETSVGLLETEEGADSFPVLADTGGAGTSA